MSLVGESPTSMQRGTCATAPRWASPNLSRNRNGRGAARANAARLVSTRATTPLGDSSGRWTSGNPRQLPAVRSRDEVSPTVLQAQRSCALREAEHVAGTSPHGDDPSGERASTIHLGRAPRAASSASLHARCEAQTPSAQSRAHNSRNDLATFTKSPCLLSEVAGPVLPSTTGHDAAHP